MEKLKLCIAAISLVMFCIQCQTAIENLINPPIVDSTTYTDITGIDLPLVTVCPVNQYIPSKLFEFDYGISKNMLSGQIIIPGYVEVTSWGGYHNLTFDELLNQMTDNKAIESIKLLSGKETVTSQIVFIPGYGLCKQISNYSSYYGLHVSALFTYSEFRVFITDKNFKTYFSVDYSSHKGSSIVAKKGEDQWYEVSLSTVSSCQVTPDQLTQDDFDKCVNDKILNTIGKPLGCIPPWMSPHNHCNGTYEYDFAEKNIPDFTWEFVETPLALRNMNLELTCRKHCSATTATIQLVEVRRKTSLFEFSSEVNIAFKQEAKLKEKVLNYSVSEFFVDVGSSLGLWLGLSVLSLYDLGVQTFGIASSVRKYF